jgi:capsular exopolysaccharide synthesis family protein
MQNMRSSLNAGGRRELESVPQQDQQAATSLVGEAMSAANLGDVLNVLKRRWLVILWSVVIITGATFALLFELSPVYTAEAMVELDTRKPQVTVGKELPLIPGLQGDVVAVVLKTETEVLRSPSLAQKVIDKLGLLNNPEFNPTLTKGHLEQLREFVVSALSLPWSKSGDSWWSEPKPSEERVLTTAVGTLLDHLIISNDGKSYVLRIRIESHDPKLAAQIANTYAELYLIDQLDSKFQETSRVNSWLNAKLADLRDKVRDSDRAVQEFKEQHGITTLTDAADAKGKTLKSQQVSELNTQLILATSERAQKEATLRQLQDGVRTGKAAEAATQILGTPLIQHLLEQEADLQRKQADMEAHFGPQYPAMIRLAAEIKDLRGKISQEVNKTITAMTNDVIAARGREATLKTQLAQMERGAASQDQSEVQLRELTRQSDANKTLYEAFLQKFKQTTAEQDITAADAHVVSEAQMPLLPSWPPKRFLTLLALVASTLVGIIVAFGLERLDSTFHSASELEGLSTLPNLGLIPVLGRAQRPGIAVASNPMSPYTEAVRSIWTRLCHYGTARPLKIILVTSSIPGEGKSSFAVSLAQAAARTGARTLLLDCDLRRPSIGRTLAIGKRDAPKGGIASVLKGEENPASVVFTHRDSAVDVMLAGEETSNPQALLQSPRMRNLLEEMRNHYDCVVVDSPPVLLASDASILSAMADATLHVVQWQKTPRRVVMNGLKALRSHGAFIAGTVLVRVDLRKQAKFGFGDVGYYYKSYKAYGR